MLRFGAANAIISTKGCFMKSMEARECHFKKKKKKNAKKSSLIALTLYHFRPTLQKKIELKLN